MKIPKITQLSSGNWFCQIRINGKSLYITEPTKELCEIRVITEKTRLLEEKKGLKTEERTNLYKALLFNHKRDGETYVNGRYIDSEKVIDKSITLKKLYKRDDGICHICGQKCDLEDYWYITGKKGQDIFVAGNKYPVVDHTIPIKFGGVQSWENVKLAHKICNTRKGDLLPLPITNEHNYWEHSAYGWSYRSLNRNGIKEEA